MQELDSCPMCQGRSFEVREYDSNPNSNLPGWTEKNCFTDKSIAVCGSCGGGFTREYLSDDEISAFYGSIYEAQKSPEEISRRQGFDEFNPRFFSQVMYLKSFAQLFDGMRILEIGPNVVSALPSLSLYCAPDYCYFDQVDSPIISSFGGRRLGSYASAASIAKEFPDATVDLIYSSHSLEHINPSSLEEMFDAFSKVTTAGGYLFFEVPDDFRYQGIFPPHTLFFTTDSIRKLVERFDYEVIDVTRWDGGERWDKKQPGIVAENYVDEIGSRSAPTIGIAKRFRMALRNFILSNAIVSSVLKPILLRLTILNVMRSISTPYETIPYFRLLARRKAR